MKSLRRSMTMATRKIPGRTSGVTDVADDQGTLAEPLFREITRMLARYVGYRMKALPKNGWPAHINRGNFVPWISLGGTKGKFECLLTLQPAWRD